MLRKMNASVSTEHVMASLPTRARQPLRLIGPSLRLRPNLKTGMLLRGRPDSSAPHPHPQLTVTSLRARCRTFLIGAV